MKAPCPSKFEFTTRSREETIELGKKIGTRLKGGDVVSLSGALAAGKTVLAKGIALALGVSETVTSPTFTVISEYEGIMPLYHFDVYRLEGADDFAHLGADDMLFGNGVCVIEWGERVQNELPPRAIFITIEIDGGERKITVANWYYGNIT
jgi:tRNA threonylcarbamoyladenosine biosynthesis protein TsaE